MKEFYLEDKSGFISYNPFRLYDGRGILFYDSDFVKKDIIEFNLPPGKYFLDGKIYKLDRPFEFKKLELPPKQRNYRRKRYQIRFGKNKNKCTVNHRLGTILFDEAFRIAPKYILYDVYAHELGHSYYKSEELADRYASNLMLKWGFNPSQIGRSPILTLTQLNSFDRKRKKAFDMMNIKKIKL